MISEVGAEDDEALAETTFGAATVELERIKVESGVPISITRVGTGSGAAFAEG